LPLVGAEIGGYLMAVTTWGQAPRYLNGEFQILLEVLRFLCAFYLVWLAFALWNAHAKTQAMSRVISPRSVFAASLCNPKSFIFALVIFPPIAFQSWQGYMFHVGIFSLCVLMIGLLWITLGGSIQGRGKLRDKRLFERAVALVIGSFALALVITPYSM